jgi:hypothetical protein
MVNPLDRSTLNDACAACLAKGIAVGAACETEPQTNRMIVCARYLNQSGFSAGYTVVAQVSNGATLNQRTWSYDHDSAAAYVSIFWGEGQASVIRMDDDAAVQGAQLGTDKRGVLWMLQYGACGPQ